MRILSDDDFIGFGREYRTPASDIQIGRLLRHPKVQREVRNLVRQAENAGLPPELMGGLFKKLVGEIQYRIKKARKKKKGGSGSPITISTPKGTATISESGVNIVNTPTGPVAVPASGGGIMDAIKDNPILLAIPAGLLAVMFLTKKRK